MQAQSNDLLERTVAYIQAHNLCQDGDQIVVGVSGGPDSITLLDILDRLKEQWHLNLHIAHIDHQLRPTASSDADFVRDVANKRNLPFHLYTYDVAQFAKNKKLSIEEAARKVRRTFLLDVSHKTGAKYIALGHTRSDQAETVLMRLIVGGGLSGLSGIYPISQGQWIRPLLSFSRNEIKSYIATRGLEVRHDETNADPKFLRNRIRTDLLPHLASTYNPQIEDVLSRTADLLQNDNAQLEILVEQALSDSTLYRDNQKIILDVTPFFGYHISLRRRLIRATLFALKANPKTTGFHAIDRALNVIDTPGHSDQITSKISIHRTQDQIIITRPAQKFCFKIEPDVEIDINGKFSAQLLHHVNLPDLQNTYSDTAFFDWDELCDQPLILRSPKSGDTLHPFGFQGHKKISRLLTDLKIPRSIRNEIPILISGNDILWVAGLRRGQLAPVTAATRQVLKTSFSYNMQSIITTI